MGFKPMTLSQNFFQLMKYQRKAYKIMPFMGFEPMTLSQNILQPIIYQRKKALKFWLSWDTNP